MKLVVPTYDVVLLIATTDCPKNAPNNEVEVISAAESSCFNPDRAESIFITEIHRCEIEDAAVARTEYPNIVESICQSGTPAIVFVSFTIDQVNEVGERILRRVRYDPLSEGNEADWEFNIVGAESAF